MLLFKRITLFMSFYCEAHTPILLLESTDKSYPLLVFSLWKHVKVVMSKASIFPAFLLFPSRFYSFCTLSFHHNSFKMWSEHLVNVTFGCRLVPAKKMRVELFDNEGNRYTVSFEGQITRDKALRLLDLVELLGGMPNENATRGPESATVGVPPSRFEKVRSVIQKSFPLVWFSSRDVQSVYEQEMKEPVSLSTVSTYLSRMASKGLLLRTGESNSLRYKSISKIAQETIRQSLK